MLSSTHGGDLGGGGGGEIIFSISILDHWTNIVCKIILISDVHTFAAIVMGDGFSLSNKICKIEEKMNYLVNLISVYFPSLYNRFGTPYTVNNCLFA